MSKEEYEALKDDISKRGLFYPIIINKEGCILDGHHRHKICQELGIQPSVIVQEFNGQQDDESKLNENVVITINLNRHQFNDFQKAELAIKLEDIEVTGRGRQRQ